MQQNTDEWHEWRMQGIGASEAPVILGLSKFKSKLQLWDEKFSKVIERNDDENTYIQEKGHMIEAGARAYFEFTSGKKWPDTLATHSQFPFIRASLDGFNEANGVRETWECKYMGKDLYNDLIDETKSLDKRVPVQYWPQLMQQAFVTDAHFVNFTGVNDTIQKHQKISYTLRFPLDEFCKNYIKDVLVPSIFEFWKSVQDGVRPEPVKQDRVEVVDQGLIKLISEYETANINKKNYETTLKSLKGKIEKHEFRTHSNMWANGFQIVEVKGSERIDYKEAFESFVAWIHQIQAISPGEQVGAVKSFPKVPSMEKYTKAGNSSFKINPPKKKKEKEVEKSGIDFEKRTTKNLTANDVPDLKVNEMETKKSETFDLLEIQARANDFKNPETGKVPKLWVKKSNAEKIKYLRTTAKKMKEVENSQGMIGLAESLEHLTKELESKNETIGGIGFSEIGLN